MGAVPSTDEEYLVRRIAQGDRLAFDELYRRTSPWLVVRLRRRCADDELVAEVMQPVPADPDGEFVGPGLGVGWVSDRVDGLCVPPPELA